MPILYKIVTIQNYADDAATEAALNAEGADNWVSAVKNSKPNAQTGKSIATIIFKKSSSSSSSSTSSSTSSSSSSSSSTSSSSSSSSSISDAPFMGAGWPYLPDTMQVVIGTRWKEANLNFVEDDVITLKRYGEDGVSIVYSEDGTLVGNAVTNRLKIGYNLSLTFASEISFKFSVANTTGSMKMAGENFRDNPENPRWGGPGITPYDFKEMWDLSEVWTRDFAMATSYSGQYFDVSYHAYLGQSYSYFGPPLQFQGEIFKSITFIDN